MKHRRSIIHIIKSQSEDQKKSSAESKVSDLLLCLSLWCQVLA